MQEGSFAGLKVLSLESRRSREIGRLIENRGGDPLLAPAVREEPTDNMDEARSFVTALLGGRVDAAIFLTGVGTRALMEAAKQFCDVEDVLAALRRLPIVARSHKPASVLRELKIPIAFM